MSGGSSVLQLYFYFQHGQGAIVFHTSQLILFITYLYYFSKCYHIWVNYSLSWRVHQLLDRCLVEIKGFGWPSVSVSTSFVVRLVIGLSQMAFVASRWAIVFRKANSNEIFALMCSFNIVLDFDTRVKTICSFQSKHWIRRSLSLSTTSISSNYSSAGVANSAGESVGWVAGRLDNPPRIDLASESARLAAALYFPTFLFFT